MRLVTRIVPKHMRRHYYKEAGFVGWSFQRIWCCVRVGPFMLGLEMLPEKET